MAWQARGAVDTACLNPATLLPPCPHQILVEELLIKGLGEHTEMDLELAEHPSAGVEMNGAKSTWRPAASSDFASASMGTS